MTHPVLGPGKRALVTGAAMGIGLAASHRFAAMGMEVVMVDLPGAPLDEAAASVPGAHAEGVDVADAAAMRALAERTGPVDLLMNNAVSRAGRGFDAALEDWRSAMDVNFWGVVHGVQAFLPGMRAAGAPGVIINVGSKQGITNPPGHPIYNASKAALKSYTESLQHALREEGDLVTAHLLVPGWTSAAGHAEKPGAWLPEQVVERIIAGLGRGEFYILCPDNEVTTQMDHKRIRWGAEDIIENRPPLSRWHPDHKDAAAKACS